MPCDSKPFRREQTLDQRKAEVKELANKVAGRILQDKIKIKVGPSGAIAFDGLSDEERGGMTDACIYRRLMATGPITVKLAIAKAEQLSGRTINKQAIAQGVHSHDGGRTWHNGH